MTEAAIQAKVAATIAAYGTSINVLKYASGPSDVYLQGEPTFAAATTCTGRAIVRPTPEKVTVIGNDETFDLAALFSQTEIAARFPLAAFVSAIDTRDRIVWGGRTYQVSQVRPTGRVKDLDHLLVVLCNALEGRTEE